MADKDVDKLAILFHDKSKFVHMSGTWKKDKELEIIKTGSIWYKNADVHDVAVECLAVLQSFGTELRYWPLYVEMKYQMNLR